MGEKLDVKSLHPVLQLVFEIGCEVGAALGASIKDGKLERTVVNLTDADEEDRDRIVSYLTPSAHERQSGISYRIPVYAKEHRWKVNFSYDKGGELHSTCSFAMENVKSELQGVVQLKILARDLQKVFGLSYTPPVYRNGKPATS